MREIAKPAPVVDRRAAPDAAHAAGAAGRARHRGTAAQARRGARAARSARCGDARRLPLRRAAAARADPGVALAAPRRRRRRPASAGGLRCRAVASSRRAPPCRARRGHRGRRWFDPWVFELDAGQRGCREGPDARPATTRAARRPRRCIRGSPASRPRSSSFPALMQLPAEQIDPPLALIYRHLGPDDLEDADALQAEIDALEPAADLAEAVEGLVRATLLLADVTRPLGSPAGRRRSPSAARAARRPCARAAARAAPAARARGIAAARRATPIRPASACARRWRCARSPSAPARRR